MAVHEVTITPFTEEGSTLYELTIVAGDLREHRTYATVEAALDSFDPRISTRVRNRVVDGLVSGGKPITFCLEDSFEEQ